MRRANGRKKHFDRDRLGVEQLEDRIALAFTAYNGLFAGASTYPNVTLYADIVGHDAAGPLRDVTSGASLDVNVVASQVSVVTDARGVNPASGTDADTIFGGFIDFTAGDQRSLEVNTSASYSYTFEDLDPGATYQFAGTAIRGNSAYTDRWTLVRLEGAASFVAAHSVGTGVVTVGLAENEVAFWSGDNSGVAQGYVAQWLDIDPGPDGVFEVVSTQYQGSVPTSIHASGQATGSKAYAVTAFRLIENEPSGPPSVENSPPVDIQAFSAELAGRVTGTGGQVPQVRLYYGTTDGGSDPAAWDHNLDLGRQSAEFSATVGELMQGTSYFYRAFAENTLGSDWADQSASFSTLVASPPEIVNSTASNVGAFSATLQADIVTTGNDPPLVTFYFGETNGGNNPGAWDHAINVGVQTGAIAVPVGDLTALTTYFFTSRAQNALGEDWADQVESFTTTDTPPLLITEFMADNVNVLTTRTRATATTPFAGDILSPDWIEIHNPTNAAVDLGGFYLTDDATDLQKWQFPSGTPLPSQGYLIVLASGLNVRATNLDERGFLHTNFQLSSSGGESLALVDGNGVVVFDYGAWPVQRPNVSYGVDATQQPRFFSQPTPGANNADDVPQSPTLSVSSRTFVNSLVVELSANLPTEVIRYTLDETNPTASSPLYTGPLTINSSAQLRAISIGANGKVSLPVSATYVRLANDVLNESSNLPILVVETFGDAIPTGSPFDDAFVGVLEPGTDGRTRVSDAFTTSTLAGMHVRGSSSSGFSKKQYRVEFWDEARADAKIPLLGMPAEADWIFYGPGVFDRALINNPLMYELSNQLGRYAVRTRWVEMYLNANGGDLTRSDYVGLYAIMEVVEEGDDRVAVGDLSTGAGGQPVEGGFIRKVDRGSAYVDPASPTSAQQTYIESWFNGLTTTAASPQRSDPEVGYARYIDVLSFIDHHILNLMSFNVDALRLSTYYHKQPGGKLEAGPIWDFDRALESTDGRDNNAQAWFDGGGTDFFNYNGTGGWWANLFDDPVFTQRYIDRWFELRHGVLSLDNIYATIDRHAAQIAEAALRDYSRWSGSRYDNFAGEIQHMKDYLRTRIEWMDRQWIAAPTFSVPGPRVTAGSQVTLSAPAGSQIFYTLDGTDPLGTGARQVQVELLPYGSDSQLIVPASSAQISACTATGVTLAAPLNCFMNPRYVLGTLGETWTSATLPVGFDQGVPSQYGGVLNTDIGAQTRGVNSSVYVRVPVSFTPEQRAEAKDLKMHVRYDDGFVAYMWFDTLNIPAEIARKNAPGNATVIPIAPLAYNAAATAVHNNSLALTEETLDIPLTYLVNGRPNYLVLQLLNANVNSDDLLFDVSLSYTGTTTETPPNVIRYTGPITVSEYTKITARAYEANHGPATQGYVPEGDDWSPPAVGTYFVDAPADATSFAISEIHYNPVDASRSEVLLGFDNQDDFEFIELTNFSDHLIELTGAKLLEVETTSGTQGVGFDFATGDVLRLEPGERVVVVENQRAFEARYGIGLPIAGEWSGRLDNDGEMLTLVDIDGNIISQMLYSDRGAWPGRADGMGSSLENVDLFADPNSAATWSPSIDYDGSPGRGRRTNIPAVVVNEILANSPESERDTIELVNTSDAPVSLAAWYLSDSSNNYFKYRIADEVAIPAHGYLAIDESDFNAGTSNSAQDFSLSSFGDDVWLLGADAIGFYFADHVDFGATMTGVSLGRVPDADPGADWFPLVDPSFGSPNGGLRRSDLIISEIHYNPIGPDAGREFIELYNNSDQAIDLSEWRINRAVDLVLPSVVILPGEVVVVVGFDPAGDILAAADFRSTYGIDASVRLIGPWDVGDVLDDGGERITLERVHDELQPGETVYDYVVMDQVRYDDELPWSVLADGNGNSLQRTRPDAFANDPQNWISDAPTPGAVDFTTRGDFDGDDDVDAQDIDALFAAIAGGNTAGRFDLTGDGHVDRMDVDHLVREILHTDYGDANLDGVIDGVDYGLWESHRFQSQTGWSQGDFNGDTVTDARDFLWWNQAKFARTEAAGAAMRSVPRTPLALMVTRNALRRRDDNARRATVSADLATQSVSYAGLYSELLNVRRRGDGSSGTPSRHR